MPENKKYIETKPYSNRIYPDPRLYTRDRTKDLDYYDPEEIRLHTKEEYLEHLKELSKQAKQKIEPNPEYFKNLKSNKELRASRQAIQALKNKRTY